MKELIIEKIKEADMVLIGLGEEFDGVAELSGMEDYEEGKALLMQSKEAALMPAWQKVFRSVQDEKIASGLSKLAEVLEGKNYFVVSVSTNAVLAQIPWREGRLVMPCGSDMRKQCTPGCENHLTVLDEGQREALYGNLEEFRRGYLTDKLPEVLGKCPCCNAQVELNNIYSEHYDENGYLPSWQLYTKWLQGTVNRKLVVLELGVGMKFPSVIRFPFEKIAYFNQKASFYRIHKNLYHLTEELSSKGVGIADNAIDWLENL